MNDFFQKTISCVLHMGFVHRLSPENSRISTENPQDIHRKFPGISAKNPGENE
jgi:hypothetical protein